MFHFYIAFRNTVRVAVFTIKADETMETENMTAQCTSESEEVGNYAIVFIVENRVNNYFHPEMSLKTMK